MAKIPNSHFRLTRPKHYPSHDFKSHHQLPDELNSNGGHPSYHPHNGQFTFGQTKELNSFFKQKQKNHHLGDYKHKFGLYKTPANSGYSDQSDIRNVIGNSFHDGRKEETFAFQVFPKLPGFNHNYKHFHGEHNHNLIKQQQQDVANEFKFGNAGPLNHGQKHKQFRFSDFNKNTV